MRTHGVGHKPPWAFPPSDRRAMHWLDPQAFPGGEIACKRGLTGSEIRTRIAKTPAQVTCWRCWQTMILRNKERGQQEWKR